MGGAARGRGARGRVEGACCPGRLLPPPCPASSLPALSRGRALAGLVPLVGPAEGPPLVAPDFQALTMGGLGAAIAILSDAITVHEAELAALPAPAAE